MDNNQPTSAEDAWRPIDTAPKDRTHILLCWSYDNGTAPRVSEAFWRNDMPFVNDGCWWYFNGRMFQEPTHWMPLPAAPGTASRPTPDTQTAAIGAEAMREAHANVALSYYADGLKPAAGWTDEQVRWWEFGVADASAAIASAIRSQPVAAPQAEMAGGAETCNRCGHKNIVWCAPSPLWNAVIRGGCINGEPEFEDMVCPNCFMEIAEDKGIADKFRVSAENVNIPLQTITPSGRVWDEHEWLWRPSPTGRGSGLKPRDGLGSSPRAATNSTPPQPEGCTVERYLEALNAIIDRGPERDSKWTGMTAKDIALFALQPEKTK